MVGSTLYTVDPIAVAGTRKFILFIFKKSLSLNFIDDVCYHLRIVKIRWTPCALKTLGPMRAERQQE